MLDVLRSGRNASCAGGRVHETPLAKQADPGHPKGQPMRKRRAQGQQATASDAFLWFFLRISKSVSAGIGQSVPPVRRLCRERLEITGFLPP